MKKIIVLDTETCGGFASPLVYDFGYVIANEKGEIIKSRSYVIKEVYDNKALFETAYYKEKRPLYEEKIANGLAKAVYWGYALKVYFNDINGHYIIIE